MRPGRTEWTDHVSLREAGRPYPGQTPVIFLIYLAAFLFFVGKMLFYSRYVGRFPDELAHISYIAYLTAHPYEIIPRFQNMQVLAAKDASAAAANTLTAVNGMGGTFTLSGGFNYLCHPPLYYQILRLAGGVTYAGGVFQIDLLRLRLCSMGIAASGLLVVFYLGWSRIGRNPGMHLLYAAVCVSVPMLAYGSAGVNNDALALLMMSLMTWGMLRLYEKRYSGGTYLLIGAGAAGSVLAKYTAGLIALLAGGIGFLLLGIRERSPRVLFRRSFLPSLPFYAGVLLYEGIGVLADGEPGAGFSHDCAAAISGVRLLCAGGPAGFPVFSAVCLPLCAQFFSHLDRSHVGGYTL